MCQLHEFLRLIQIFFGPYMVCIGVSHRLTTHQLLLSTPLLCLTPHIQWAVSHFCMLTHRPYIICQAYSTAVVKDSCLWDFTMFVNSHLILLSSALLIVVEYIVTHIIFWFTNQQASTFLNTAPGAAPHGHSKEQQHLAQTMYTSHYFNK